MANRNNMTGIERQGCWK